MFISNFNAIFRHVWNLKEKFQNDCRAIIKS